MTPASLKPDGGSEMSHTVSVDVGEFDWRAHFNSDFSGKVTILSRGPDDEPSTDVDVPGELILALFERWVETP